MAGLTSWDFLIDAATQWMDEEPDRLADLLLEGEQSPWAADISPQDKLAYYSAQFFSPDGTPNEVGRKEELDRLGIDAYVKALKQVQQIRGIYAPSQIGEFAA